MKILKKQRYLPRNVIPDTCAIREIYKQSALNNSKEKKTEGESTVSIKKLHDFWDFSAHTFI